MPTKIGLLSDVHATVEPLREAITLFKKSNVSKIICAGDIAGYGEELLETVKLLQANNVLVVRGNHEEWYLENEGEDEVVRGYFDQLPVYRELTVENKTIYLVHAHPPDGIMGGMKLLDMTGQIIEDELDKWSESIKKIKSDVLIVGHTHQVFSVNINDTLVINPGSSKYNNSCAILELPEMIVNWYPLAGKRIESVWNWSSQFRNN